MTLMLIASRRQTTWSSWLSFVLFGLLLWIPNVNANANRDDAQQVLKLASTTTEVMTHASQHPVPHPPKPFDPLDEMLDALEVLENQYFEVWEGVWPTSIDWTSAVVGTHVSAVLNTLSVFFEYSAVSGKKLFSSAKAQENLIDRYFSQLTASYFGQDAFSLRNEAYDDMLWVVLGWLESIKFIKTHDALHYSGPRPDLPADGRYSNTSAWHGTQWIPAFAHRARIFWDLASKGWDTSLCGGGMIWSPYLQPYKNAITNELYIAASISMYLYFPGDPNTSPFGIRDSKQAHDPKFLAAAIEGYKWLSHSNMTDVQGLYVDGYHISGWSSGGSTNTKCDSRNEMVYTYNQGVILSGQRGLWEATGARSYLEDGHKLIADVINATGYDLWHDRPYKDFRNDSTNLTEWYGLGRSGILEEACDSSGSCSQDGQTFKGIFFHHLTVFCRPLPLVLVHPGQPAPAEPEEDAELIAKDLRAWHSQQCARYRGWISRNARAAMSTKDSDGRFGMWWGVNLDIHPGQTVPTVPLPLDAVDYRNGGVPRNHDWMSMPGPVKSKAGAEDAGESALRGRATTVRTAGNNDDVSVREDLNDRGRGRTVETQSGGLAVLRAMQEIVVMQEPPRQ